MNAAVALVLLGLSASAPTAADLAGAWAGTMTHEGESQPIALEFEPGDEGKVLIKATIPVFHLARAPLGSPKLEIQGNELRLGPFSFTYDASATTLSGVMPAGLVPVYRVPMTLRRVERVDVPPRPEPKAPVAKPVWTYEAGAPLWAGPRVASGVLYVGGEDGRLHALDARTGKPRWSFSAGGKIRTRATVSGSDLYLQADDGFLYKLDVLTGAERWRVRVSEKPIERLPFDNPKSRFDRFGSDVTVAGGRLYLGTHDGKLLALDPTRGEKAWEFPAGDSILAAPTVASGRVYFGSYDKHVYALDEASGQLIWKYDTKGAVVSTPAADGGVVVVGTRAYDLLGLDARTGEPAWKRYIWFSWVESSPTIKGGVAYVGSSDAAAVHAFDVRTGERLWKTDVYGWPWGQPAVTDTRVYAGAASQVGYLAQHRAGVFALDRASGNVVWHFPGEPPASGAYGFPGSPAVGEGLVFASGLDGRVYAFAEQVERPVGGRALESDFYVSW